MRPDGLKVPHGWQDISISQIRKYLPTFKEKFLHEPVAPGAWAFQRCYDLNVDQPKVDYSHPKVPISEIDYIGHFRGKPVREGPYYKGAIAFHGQLRDEVCKWFCLDADSPEWVDIVSKTFMPCLSEYG